MAPDPQPTQVGDTWFRITSRLYASLCADDTFYARPSLRVEEETYEVVKVTPKGVWLQQVWRNADLRGSEMRFVRLSARKRFAHPTKDDALASFVARKTRQMKILSAQLANAQEARNIAQAMLECNAAANSAQLLESVPAL